MTDNWLLVTKKDIYVLHFLFLFQLKFQSVLEGYRISWQLTGTKINRNITEFKRKSKASVECIWNKRSWKNNTCGCKFNQNLIKIRKLSVLEGYRISGNHPHQHSQYFDLVDGKRGPGRPKMTWKQLTKRDCREWKLSAINPYDRRTWRSGVRSAMRAASQLSRRGPTDVNVAPVTAR